MVEDGKQLQRYRRPIDLAGPISLVGEAAVDFGGRQMEQADDKYLSGLQTIRRYTTPEMDAVALAAAKEMAVSIKAELNQITLTAYQTEHLIGQGKLSMTDLCDKNHLKEKLGQMENLSAFEKRKIVKYRQEAHDLITVKEALLARNKGRSGLDKKERGHLASRDYFDLGDRRTNELLKTYFKTTDNNVLKSVNPTLFNEKQIRGLIKTGKKNGFTMQDEAALRLAERQIRNRAVRIKTGRMVNIKRRIEMLKTYACRIDGNTGAGIQNIVYTAQVAQAGHAVAKLGLKAGIVTVSFAAKYTGTAYLLSVLNRIRQKKTAQAVQAVKAAVKGSKPYQRAGDKKKAVKKWLEEKPSVQKMKETRKIVSEKGKAAARKGRRVKAAAKAAGRRLQQGGNVVFGPLRLVGRLIHSFRGAMGKLKMAVMAVAGIVIAAFVIFVVLLNAMLSVCRTESETAMSVVMTEDDSFIASVTALLQEKEGARRGEAEKIISDGPQNTYVYGAQVLSRYGHPDGDGGWVEGGRLIYVDGSGNQLLMGANNSKDVIVAAYIVMDADFDEDKRARDDLILDMWHMMNPAIEAEESEIYCCSAGCGSFSYTCDSDADYEAMERLQSEGAQFHGEIEECPEERDGDGLPGESRRQICGGHSVNVCYGHRDITVFIPVMSLEDIFRSGELPSAQGKSYAGYIQRFEGWTEENIEWALSLYHMDWFELYGTDPSAGAGGAAGGGISPEQILSILDGYGDVDAVRAALCADAMSFVGQIPYYWGGKAATQSYEGNRFNTAVTPDYKGRNRKGLDCSGFVQWTIWRVTGVKPGGSTSTVTSGMERIAAVELQPGDLGLMNLPGAASNHVGIFVGYNDAGQALWCHENGADGNVSVNTTTCFKYYYRLF